ncbi:hypothetical protein [Dyadobacter sp. Leaf189]|uniref:hypothetical protein n=1 Tax=Dyadobacter sp. Leaf189 TaxID=1736295 RepID=UPI0006F2CB4C|nr:hypothetical protein [Dyadobacter sp. Leaf189]KQS24695.1 hypothetical protein ASG33_23335 [Dyadobacter sp. Leaf189]
MNTVRVEIEDDKDIPQLEKLLTELGYKFYFEFEPEESAIIPEAALFGIAEGLKDRNEGKVFDNFQARQRIDRKISEMQQKAGGQ